MADNISKRRRSWVMSRVKSKDTTPELVVRRVAHSLGLRFRLHRKGLPGTPDLVFPKMKVAMFVHGCFWHQHSGCKRARIPKSRRDYWAPKLQRNVARDRESKRKLRRLGWRPVVIWECQTRNPSTLRRLLCRLLMLRRPSGKKTPRNTAPG